MQLTVVLTVALVLGCSDTRGPVPDPLDDELRALELDVHKLSADWEELVAGFSQLSARYREPRTHGAAIAAWAIYRDVLKLAVVVEAMGAAYRCKRVSTAAYRKQLRAQGIDLDHKDIDHIVPRAHGGVDHPANYQVIDSSLNRSLGKTWDIQKCLMPGRDRCIKAIGVTVKCGTYLGGFF